MNDIRYSRRASPPEHKVVWRDCLRENWGDYLTFASFVGFAFWMLVNAFWVTGDVAGTPIFVDRAKIVTKSYFEGGEGGHAGWMLVVDLRGRRIDAGLHGGYDLDNSKVGSQVSVMYQTGRSGTVYVRSVHAEEPSVAHKVSISPARR